MSRRRILGFGLLMMMVGSACGVSSLGETPDAGSRESPTPKPTEGPVLPISINEGLASLDSYRMTYTSEISDSVSQEQTATTFVIAGDRTTDASYTRTETRVTSGESADASEDVQEQFAIGNQLCSLSDGGAELTTVSGPARVMSDLMSQVVVFHPLIENPVFVGDEIVNGVPVHTYTFDVRSLGATSEVEVARSDGSYAVAVDGDYLVHYRLDLELRTAAVGDSEAESSVLSIEVSLEDVNQPVAITFPPGCQAAGE